SQNATISLHSLAKDHGVSKDTILRDAAFARGVDIVEKAMPGARQAILSGRSRTTKQLVTAVGKVKGKDRTAYVKRLTSAIKGKETPPALPKTFGSVSYPDGMSGLYALGRAMEDCQKYPVEDYRSL